MNIQSGLIRWSIFLVHVNYMDVDVNIRPLNHKKSHLFIYFTPSDQNHAEMNACWQTITEGRIKQTPKKSEWKKKWDNLT